MKLYRCVSKYQGREKEDEITCFQVYPYKVDELGEAVFEERDSSVLSLH